MKVGDLEGLVVGLRANLDPAECCLCLLIEGRNDRMQIEGRNDPDPTLGAVSRRCIHVYHPHARDASAPHPAPRTQQRPRTCGSPRRFTQHPDFFPHQVCSFVADLHLDERSISFMHLAADEGGASTVEEGASAAAGGVPGRSCAVQVANSSPGKRGGKPCQSWSSVRAY